MKEIKHRAGKAEPFRTVRRPSRKNKLVHGMSCSLQIKAAD
jgi:hypothetical protein